MQVIDNKAILLNLRNPDKVTSVIPKSKKLSGNKVLVNWGVDESHVLKNLNIKVPSPIEGNTDGQVNTNPLTIKKQHLLFLL